MGLELSPEKEEEYINRVAEYIVKSGMEMPAKMLLTGARPVSYVGSQLFTAFYGPLASVMGSWTEDLTVLAYKRENIDRIVQRIDQLSRKKERQNQRPPAKDWKEKVKRIIFG